MHELFHFILSETSIIIIISNNNLDYAQSSIKINFLAYFHVLEFLNVSDMVFVTPVWCYCCV